MEWMNVFTKEKEPDFEEISEYKLYKKTTLFNGSRWLMIDVTTEEILHNVEELLCIRIHPKKVK